MNTQHEIDKLEQMQDAVNEAYSSIWRTALAQGMRDDFDIPSVLRRLEEVSQALQAELDTYHGCSEGK